MLVPKEMKISPTVLLGTSPRSEADMQNGYVGRRLCAVAQTLPWRGLQSTAIRDYCYMVCHSRKPEHQLTITKLGNKIKPRRIHEGYAFGSISEIMIPRKLVCVSHCSKRFYTDSFTYSS